METLSEFSPEAKRELIGLIDSRIGDKLRDLLPTREDFSELKSIVQELAQAQHELAEAPSPLCLLWEGAVGKRGQVRPYKTER